MIFVTVGTTYFDELIQEVDRLTECGIIQERVLAQIGAGVYVPKHIEWVRYVENMPDVAVTSDLVICHGGVGSVFELLSLAKPFIAVPNRSVQDDHQADLLRALESEGICHCCWDLRQLGETLGNSRGCGPYILKGQLAQYVWMKLL